MAAPQSGNGPNPQRTKECVDRIEAVAARKATAHMAYMAECSVFAEETKEIYDEAKNAWGLNKRALKAVIRARAAEKKLEALRDNLEGDEQETFDQIRHALGDLAETPLGAAALKGKDDEDVRSPAQKRRAKERDERSAAMDALSAEPSNGADKLAAGIRPLN